MIPVEDLRHRLALYEAQRAWYRRCVVALLILVFIIPSLVEAL